MDYYRYMNSNVFPQAPKNDIPCYCYQCLKNVISKPISNNNSACYKYVISAAGIKALNERKKLRYTENKANSGEGIDYYTYRLKKKEHMFDRNSDKFMKNLIDSYSTEAIMKSSIDASLRKKSSKGSVIQDKITELNIRPSRITLFSLKFETKKSEQIYDEYNNLSSDHGLSLSRLFSSEWKFPIIDGNEDSRILVHKNSKNETSIFKSDAVSAEIHPPSDKSIKTCESRIMKGKAYDFECRSTTPVENSIDLQIYTLFSNQTESNSNENKLSHIPTQKITCMNFEMPDTFFPTSKSVAESKTCEKAEQNRSAHESSSNSKRNCKPLIIKELWRPLTFSCNNNVGAKSRKLRMNNKEGMMNRIKNENLRLEHRLEPTTLKSASKSRIISKEIDFKINLTNTDKSEDQRKNKDGKNSPFSFKSQNKLNYQNSSNRKTLTVCNEKHRPISSSNRFTENRRCRSPSQQQESSKAIAMENPVTKWVFDLNYPRSKLPDRTVDKCKGDSSQEPNSCREVGTGSTRVVSAKKRRITHKSSQNNGKNKKILAKNVNRIEICSKSKKSYRTVITRKICLIKKRKYISLRPK